MTAVTDIALHASYGGGLLSLEYGFVGAPQLGTTPWPVGNYDHAELLSIGASILAILTPAPVTIGNVTVNTTVELLRVDSTWDGAATTTTAAYLLGGVRTTATVALDPTTAAQVRAFLDPFHNAIRDALGIPR